MIHMFKFNSQSASAKKKQHHNQRFTNIMEWRERKIISKSMFGFEVGRRDKILEADWGSGWRLASEVRLADQAASGGGDWRRSLILGVSHRLTWLISWCGTMAARWVSHGWPTAVAAAWLAVAALVEWVTHRYSLLYSLGLSLSRLSPPLLRIFV